MTRPDESPLGIARGAAREGLAALEAFGDLLGSRRVGPKALERARSEMGEASTSLAQAFRDLDAALEVSLGADAEAAEVARSICDQAASRAAALLSDLSARASIEGARRRLALEVAIRKHGAELRDALGLCDLLAAAALPLPTELDLVDLVDQRFGGKPPDPSALRLAVDAPRPTPILADRHVLGGLLEIAISLVAQSGATIARLSALRSSVLSVRVAPMPPKASLPKTLLFVSVRAPSEAARLVGPIAARRAKLGFSIDPASSSVSISC